MIADDRTTTHEHGVVDERVGHVLNLGHEEPIDLAFVKRAKEMLEGLGKLPASRPANFNVTSLMTVADLVTVLQNRPATTSSVRIGTSTYRVSTVLHPLVEAIEQSRCMIGLKEDFELNQGQPITAATWERAASLLLRMSDAAWRDSGLYCPPPYVDPGPAGSIDIHWDLTDRELLLNVPVEPLGLSTFYGDDKGNGAAIKGSIAAGDFGVWIVAWLSKR